MVGEAAAPWGIVYYRRPGGGCPVGDFLASLKRSRPKEYGKTLSKFALFESLGLQGALELRLLASLKGHRNIYELRIKGTGLRFYGFTRSARSATMRQLVLASAEDKDGDPDVAAVRAALEARNDWNERFGAGD